MTPEEAKQLKISLQKLRKAIEDEDIGGMSVYDEGDLFSDEDDPAAKYLAEQEAKGKEDPKEEKKARSYSKDWEAPDAGDKADAIKAMMDEGYSEREAHRHHGTHKEEPDFQQAMNSGINPSHPSVKMQERLKELAAEWRDNKDKQERTGADIERNPQKHAHGQIEQAHEGHVGDYKGAYQKFLDSDDVKGLKGRDRHKAIKEWKANYKEENPGYTEGLSDVAGKQSGFSEARDRAKQSLEDKKASIMMGGGFSGEGMSAKEGMQHAGFDTKEMGEGSTVQPQQDPLAQVAKNPKLMAALSGERHERMKRVDTAAKAQGVTRTKKATDNDNK